MAGIFTAGGNPFAQDPLQMLSTSAMQGDQTPPVQAPAFADPQTTGAIAGQGTPGAGTAQSAAPQGGAGSDQRGIMDRLSDAFSGRQGLFGSPSADDNEIDPMTGAPKGLARQAGMRSMMQMGLTFLLAGQRMSGDQRAAILSKAPGLVGGGDDALNSFAKTRLEMAKLRLEQQKMQQEQASQQTIMSALGMGGGSAAPAPTLTAGAQGVQAGQQALAQAAPAVAAPDANAAPGGGIPANAAGDLGGMTPTLAPPPMGPTGEQGVSAPQQAPASIASPGGVPRMAPQQQATGVGDDPRNYTHAEKLAIIAQPTTAGKANALLQVQQARAAGVRMGPVQYDQTTGEQFALKMDGRGNVIGREALGKPTITTRDTGDYREKGYTDPITKQFVVTDRSDIQESPGSARMARADIEAATKDRDALKETYTGSVQTSAQSFGKLKSLYNDIDAGKGVFGTGADLRRQAYNALATLGYDFDGKLTGDLNTTANFERFLKGKVAETIKSFNGSQNVSDGDRKFAVDVMQAAATGNREAVKNALRNAAEDTRMSVERYNENAKNHNSLLSGFQGDTRKRYEVPIVDGDFTLGQPKQQAAPQGGGVVRYERRDGKIVRVQD